MIAVMSKNMVMTTSIVTINRIFMTMNMYTLAILLKTDN